MRQESAHSIKWKTGRKPKYRGAALQQEPKVGSHLRLLYDRLMNQRGEPVDLSDLRKGKSGTDVKQLRDFYGLDIRAVGKNTGHFMLVGEWVGRVYVDYYAEKNIK